MKIACISVLQGADAPFNHSVLPLTVRGTVPKLDSPFLSECGEGFGLHHFIRVSHATLNLVTSFLVFQLQVLRRRKDLILALHGVHVSFVTKRTDEHSAVLVPLVKVGVNGPIMSPHTMPPTD
jgi:hypothetical protein